MPARICVNSLMIWESACKNGGSITQQSGGFAASNLCEINNGQ
jgi:hypothetical protein